MPIAVANTQEVVRLPIFCEKRLIAKRLSVTALFLPRSDHCGCCLDPAQRELVVSKQLVTYPAPGVPSPYKSTQVRVNYVSLFLPANLHSLLLCMAPSSKQRTGGCQLRARPGGGLRCSRLSPPKQAAAASIRPRRSKLCRGAPLPAGAGTLLS